MKQCKKCLKTRDFIAFYKRSDYADGYSPRCKACWAPGYSTTTPDPSLTELRCPKCSVTKPTSEFGKNRNNKNGYASYCKPCARERAKSRYHSDHAYKFKRLLSNKLWKEDNPERHNAAVRRAKAKYAARKRLASAESHTSKDTGQAV